MVTPVSRIFSTFFFSSRRRHTRYIGDWSSDVCSSDLRCATREYCEIRGPRTWLINGLVYPMPHAHGLSLGVHFTKTLWGTVLVGPTAIYVEGKDNYEKGRLAVADFARSAKTLLPEVEESDLQLGYSGLRPKLVPPDATDAYGDFVIERDPKVPNAIQLVGIESPGLTSAPSIALQAAQLAAEVLA